MSLLSNLLLVASLAALSLAGCASEDHCSGDVCLEDSEADAQPDLIRIEIEVEGRGSVVVEGEEAVRCSGDQGLCSFSYARGTDLIVYAEAPAGASAEWQDACQGVGPCYINLDVDQVVVASFQDEAGGLRKPGKPTIVVDPIPGWYRDYAEQSIDPASLASAE